MNLLKIEISKEGRPLLENLSAGQMGEGNITRLKFIVPSEYKEFFKYLDILKGNGEKIQTVVGDCESEIFYYNIPYSLTDCRELFIQLVMKLKDKIFKSRVIALHFDESLSATEYYEESFQDTIEYLAEIKADRDELKKLEASLLLKAGKSEVYELHDTVIKDIRDLREKDNIRIEGLQVITDSLKDKKVDKVYGKGLSSNDFSDTLKAKLEALPDKSTFENILSDKVTIIRYDRYDESFSLDNFQENGVYILIEADGDVYNISTLFVWWDFDTLNQVIEHQGGYGKSKRLFSMEEWSPWEIIDTLYSSEEKEKLNKLPDGNEISSMKEQIIENRQAIENVDSKYNLEISEVRSIAEDNQMRLSEVESRVDSHETSIGDLNNYDQELFNMIDEANTQISNINISIGNIESALDELHNYAQALVSGGEA
ncbi:MAG: hypothetical protein E7411_03420 [Ruminococcaceae bacterium]|nr:hypothetical protein [Oscillospiraceae bacterium]